MDNEIAVNNLPMNPVDNVEQQFKMVNDLYKRIMIKDEHYGIIPGTKKDTLYKAGAEKLCLMFKLVPKIESKEEKNLGNGHKEIEIVIGLYHKETGALWGQGIGSCSTMESKFRWRSNNNFEITDISIPKDAKENKAKYKKEGYGMQKVDGNWFWVHYTSEEKVENPDIADVYNTVLKMAYKRALVSATITATGVSDIFTQDIEDFVPQDTGEKAIEKHFGQPNFDKMKDLPQDIKDGFASLGFRSNPMKAYQLCEDLSWDNDKIKARLNSLATEGK